MKNSILTLLALCGLMLNSCKQEDSTITPASKAKTYYGDVMALGGDSVRSWIKTDLNGNPSSAGVTFNKSILQKLQSAGMDTMTMLMLPMNNGAALAAPFDHVEVDWTPEKTDPSPYENAHIDA